MKFSHLVFVLLLSAAVAFVTAKYAAPAMQGKNAESESAFHRVIRTDTLRCGYQYWDGGVMRNEKTGKIYGPWVNVTDALAKAIGLKVEWTEQVGWGDVAAALKSHKVDAICAGIWTSGVKAREIAYTVPLAYQGIEAIVRADDHRFDGDVEKLNSPNVRLAVIDADNSDFIARQDFPKAKLDSLGQLTGTDSQQMMDVATGKADATFDIAGLFIQFNKNNANKLRLLMPGHMLRTFGLAFAVDNDEPKLLRLMNTGAEEIEYSGQLDKILDQGNKNWPEMYIKPTKPF
ncbi:MAG: transporter substrate-binding domain-containing protein [Alphaproteobacteria bacterium]|nr:transporter substrate-binding domain-containing protein [Alphaproteobacteria bacterium]